MAAPQAATVPVFTASAHSLEPLILDHKKGGEEAQRGVLRLSLDVHATAVWEARKGRIGPGGPPSGRRRRVCVALIRHSVSRRLRLRPSMLQLAGAKSRTYAPDGTCTRLSVLRIAGYGTAVLPQVAPPILARGYYFVSLFRLFSSCSFGAGHGPRRPVLLAI